MMKTISFAALLLISSHTFGAQYYQTNGECEFSATDRKEICPGGMAEDREVKFTEHTIQLKQSNTLSTKASPCSKAEESAILEFAKKWVNSGKDETREVIDYAKTKNGESPIPKIFKIHSCTIITDKSEGPKFLAEIRFPEEKFTKDDPGHDEVGLVISGDIHYTEIKNQIIQAHRKTTTDGRQQIEFQHFCDIDGDGKAEFIFRKKGYYLTDWLIFKSQGTDRGYKAMERLKEGACGC